MNLSWRDASSFHKLSECAANLWKSDDPDAVEKSLQLQNNGSERCRQTWISWLKSLHGHLCMPNSGSMQLKGHLKVHTTVEGHDLENGHPFLCNCERKDKAIQCCLHENHQGKISLSLLAVVFYASDHA